MRSRLVLESMTLQARTFAYGRGGGDKLINAVGVHFGVFFYAFIFRCVAIAFIFGLLLFFLVNTWG